MVCSKCVQITDAAKRMSGIVNVRILCTPFDQLSRSWMAFKLEDGSSDGTLYDTKEDAIRFQLHETMCAYLCMRQAMGGINPRDCQIFLNMHRYIYENNRVGFSRTTQDMIMSQWGYDVLLGRRDPYA